MAVLKNVVITFVVLVVLFLGVGFLLPSEFKVERSVTIDAQPEAVFAEVANLRKWRGWGVWFKRDPQMQITYSGPEGAIGMKSEWTSESEGSGEMQVLEMVPNQKMVYSLYFPEFEMGSTGELVLEQQDGQTKVTWMDYGDVGSNPVNHYFAAFMDSMIGPDFEAGLSNLKTVVENKS